MKNTVAWIAWSTLVAGLLTGCGQKEQHLETAYGVRRGSEGAGSVNGLGVLASMYERAGFRVSSNQSLAGNSDVKVIVWAPDEFDLPDAQQRKEIFQWLAAENDRTFVYIGRDYDAAIDYWDAISAKVPATQAEEVARRRALARSQHAAARSAMPQQRYAGWATLRRDRPKRRVRSLVGPWAEETELAGVDIHLQGEFDVPSTQEVEDGPQEDDADDELARESDDEFEFDVPWLFVISEEGLQRRPLLSAAPATQDDPLDAAGGFRADAAPLVTEVKHRSAIRSRLLLVTNGSFLLNLPLIKPAHRKLAGKLIEQSGEPSKVVFWEPEEFGASSAPQDSNEWSALTTWPLNFILLHLAVLGFLYMLWRFPIFGRPKEVPQPSTSDFAKHLEALGDLMADTEETTFARAKLLAYHHTVRHESADKPDAER